jgi:hypothetical protein
MRRLVLLALVACGGSGGAAGGGVDASMPPANDGSSPVVPETGADAGAGCGFDQPGTLMSEMSRVVAAMAQGAAPGSTRAAARPRRSSTERSPRRRPSRRRRAPS